MKKMGRMSLVLLGIWLAPCMLCAGDFDGTAPLICATAKVIECTEDGDCETIRLEDVGMPRFFRVDFEKKEIRSTRENGSGKVSRIVHLERIDGKLILQGAEDGVEGVRDGVGWTVAISEATGEFVLTASGEAVAFVAFGASMPLL